MSRISHNKSGLLKRITKTFLLMHFLKEDAKKTSFHGTLSFQMTPLFPLNPSVLLDFAIEITTFSHK
jgi:hypothetical protein